MLDCEARCDPDSEDGDGIDIKRDLARRDLRTPQKSSWPTEHHFEDRLLKVTSESSFEVQRLCTDLNAVNAKMKKKLSVPGA
jgi:hypothetical protein